MEADGFRDLVMQAQAGDKQATTQLLAVIRPWLEQRARGYADPCQPDASASDLAQEAWLRAWQKLHQFHGSDDDEQTLAMFRVWVGRILQRLGLNALRDREAQHRKPPGAMVRLGGTASQAGLDPAGSEPTPSAHAAVDEQVERVRRVLERIVDATDREIVRLRFFEGLSLRQIAERLQSNHENVRQRFHAVLRQLEHDLKELL
jgi:RNA polymerase sigma factor (sigma-70 family)